MTAEQTVLPPGRKLDVAIVRAQGDEVARVGVYRDPECGGWDICPDCVSERMGFTLEDKLRAMPTDLHDHIRDAWHEHHHAEDWCCVGSNGLLGLVPAYSTDGAAAGSLLEQFDIYEVSKARQPGTNPPYYRADVGRYRPLARGWALGLTGPHAAALAVLNALTGSRHGQDAVAVAALAGQERAER